MAMGPDLEVKEKPSSAAEAIPTKGNGSVQREPKDRIGLCTTNFDNKMSQIQVPHDGSERGSDAGLDIEVNIVDLKDSAVTAEVEDRCQDATESMSSFGDTVSEKDNGSLVSDNEVESKISTFNVCDGVFGMRKKKLTHHWRKFIHPLMWRCQWIELKINEFHSQALKYDRELTEQEHKKLPDYEQIMVEGPETRSRPFSSSTQRSKAVKRKKRRLEETADVASYLRQHNLFSYLETKKSAANGARASVMHDSLNIDKRGKGNDEFLYQDGWASLELREGDSLNENIIRKIDGLQLQVRDMKTRVAKVISENPLKFSSLNVLSVGVHSEQDITLHAENEARVPVKSPHISSPPASEYNMGELIPENAIPNHEEEEILIHNQAAHEEIQNYRSLGTLLREKPEETTERHIPSVDSLDLPKTRAHFPGKSLPKSRANAPTKKGKRGKRKPRAARH